MRKRGLVLLWMVVMAACTAEPKPYLVVTSDTHLSNPEGRWPHTVNRFQALLNELKNAPPQFIFVVGDVVDNVRSMPDGSPRAGDKSYWMREVDVYRRAQATLPETQFLQSLGPGHDYMDPVTLDDAEKTLGARNGAMMWRGKKLIWLTVPTASFWVDGRNYRSSMSKEEYAWLDSELQSARRAILLFHVPLRTGLTFRYGKWPGGMNLTIDPRDPIYPIIDRHAARIEAIFNGHIHKFIKSSYRDIPLFVCPFFDHGCHCKVYDAGDGLKVLPVNCPDRSQR